MKTELNEEQSVGRQNKEPIRVLHVVTQMNRNGLESRIMDIYRNIDRNQIQFDFLTHRKVHGQFDDEIQSLGGKVYYLSPIKPQKIINYIRSLDAFFAEHSEYKIVHAHLNSYCTWVLAAAKRAGVPVRIAHSRNSGMDHNWKAIFKYLSKLFVNGPATHKFACSQQAGVWLFGKKGIEEPNYFRVIPNGFNLSKFDYSPQKRDEKRKELGLTDEFAVVHVGRLTYQKNHAFLFSVFDNILKERPDAKMFLFGDGELKESLVEKAKQMGIEKAVRFMGNQSNVGEYLQAMDAMVFPSVYEGFGTVVIESQCIGLPTLASDVLPRETKVTDRLEFMSLTKDTPQAWANKVTEMYLTIPRKNRTQEVREAGYDINDTYHILSEFYTNVFQQ